MSLALDFAGTYAELDLSGAIYWPDQQILTVADLHFEKGSSFAAQRYLPVPPHDTAETLSRLSTVIERYRPRQVICLGDSFHDKAAIGRLNPTDLDDLRQLGATCDWIWLSGNHDPQPPQSIGGRAAHRIVIGNIVFQHDLDEGTELSSYEGRKQVFGHYHPIVLLSVGGRLLRRKCFAVGRDRLLQPAFGAYTGGLNVLDPAIRACFVTGFDVVAVGRNHLHPISAEHLRHETTSFRGGAE